MSPGTISRHALGRMNQRAISPDDLALIKMIGTAVDDGYLVLNRDCQAAERELKRLLEQVRRLSGKRMVTAGDRVVTVYRAGRSTERKLVRRTEERQLGI